MKRPLIITGICVLLLIIIIVIKMANNKNEIEVEKAKVQKRTIVETVSANGKIQPEVEVKISSDVSGEVVELNVKEGDMVKKGDVLCRINPDIYETAMERMVAAVNTAKANLANTLARHEQVKSKFSNDSISFIRTKKLYDQGVISQSEYELQKTNYDNSKNEVNASYQNIKAAEYNVNSAVASLSEANKNLGKTTIIAPVNGRIIKLGIEKGERVVGTAQMTGTEMMVIASSNEMEVSVEVNENDIVRVHMNDTTMIDVDAYLPRRFKGIVTEIAESANTTGISADQVTNFIVKIRILQDSYKDLPNPFRRGMSATVEIMTKYSQNVLSLPIQSVTTRVDSTLLKDEKKKDEEEDNSGLDVTHTNKKAKKEEKLKPEEVVFLFGEDGKAKMVKVKVGIQDENFIEVLSGLKEGDVVISGPYSAVSRQLKDGSEIVEKKEPETTEET
jgi:HlyD family secretion protein